MDLLVKAQLNVYTKLLTLTDLIAAEYLDTYGYALANCQGMFKITGPNSIIYENAGWDTDDYSSPDTDGSGTPNWEKGSINLPMDSDGKVLLGNYQVEYKVTLDGTGDTTFSFDKTYTNLYVAPQASIVTYAVVSESYMMVTDNTEYGVTILGDVYDPDNTLTDSRVLTSRWPVASGVADTVSSAASVQLGPNIWSGTYTVTLSQLVLYSPPAAIGLTVEISDTIIGTETVTVSSDNCVEIVQGCLLILTAQYEQAKLYNKPEAQSIKVNLDDIMLYYEMYKIAVSTGSDTTYSCNKLRELLTQNGCTTCGSGSTGSVEIVPRFAATSKNEFIVIDPAGQSVFTLTFTLTTNSLVLIEGQAILNSQVSGFGTMTLTTDWTVPAGQTVIVIEKVF